MRTKMKMSHCDYTMAFQQQEPDWCMSIHGLSGRNSGRWASRDHSASFGPCTPRSHAGSSCVVGVMAFWSDPEAQTVR